MRPVLSALAAVAVVLALCACSSASVPSENSPPPPVVAKALVTVEGKADASLELDVFGFPTKIGAKAEAGGTLDIDSSRTPVVVVSGSWSITREDGAPPGAPPLVGHKTAASVESPCAACGDCPPEKPKVAAPAPDPCAKGKVGAAPPKATFALPSFDLGSIFGCDESKRGKPVYVGCAGTAGGNRPQPYGDVDPAIPPGTGWPCPKAKVGAAPGCPVGIAAILGGLSDLLSGRFFGP